MSKEAPPSYSSTENVDDDNQSLAHRYVANAITASLANERARRDGSVSPGSPSSPLGAGRTAGRLGTGIKSFSAATTSRRNGRSKTRGLPAPSFDAELEESDLTAPFHFTYGPLGIPRIESTTSISNLMGYPSPGGQSASGNPFSLHGLQIDTDISRCQSLAASRAASAVFTGLTSIVDDVLAIGSHRDVCDVKNIRALGIRAFLCVAQEVFGPIPAFVSDEDLECGCVEFKHMRLADMNATQLADSFEEAFDFIDRNAAAGRPVALFCQMGKSRSASLVTAYLMREHDMDGESALALLSSIYPKADPNIGFISQLQRLRPEDLPKRMYRRPSETPSAGESGTGTPVETPKTTDIGMTPVGRAGTAAPSPMTSFVKTASTVAGAVGGGGGGGSESSSHMLPGPLVDPTRIPSYLNAQDPIQGDVDIPWAEDDLLPVSPHVQPPAARA